MAKYETMAWMDPRHLPDNPAVRNEVRKTTDWKVLAAKPLPEEKMTDQSWNGGRIGPSSDRSPLHTGPQGPATPAVPGPGPSERYPEGYVTVQPKGKRLHVQVADSPARPALGLQNTPDLQDHDAMLFRWPADASASLHNKNVNIPVSAQWFDSEGMYVDHAHMLPDDPTMHSPRSAHRYVLETHRKNFDAFGLGPGSSMDMGDDARNGTIQMS